MSVPSLSRNMKNYFIGFLWLAVAISVASVIHLISTSIPNQEYVIGSYNTTITLIPTQTTIATRVVPYTVIFGTSTRAYTFPQQCHYYSANNTISPRATATAPFQCFNVTQGQYVINLNWVTLTANIPQAGVIGLIEDLYSPGASINDWRDGVVYADGDVRIYCKGGSAQHIVCGNTVPGTVAPNGVIIPNCETITTTIPATVTTTTLIPGSDSLTLSNRSILEIIGFGVFVLITIIGINKLLKMII